MNVAGLYCSDLLKLNLGTMFWTEESNTSSPSARAYHGFAALNGGLYCHGGIGQDGACQRRCLQISIKNLAQNMRLCLKVMELERLF